MKKKSTAKTPGTQRKPEPVIVLSRCPSRPLRPCGSTGSGATSSVPESQSDIPQSSIGNPRGFTYIGLLAILIIIGISLGAAGKYWQNVILRDKEEELLFRGDMYRQAIERYYYAVPGRPQYPKTIDDLLQDPRTAGKRYLRQKYKDHMTGEDFVVVEVLDQLGKHIIGVHSPSDKTPLKQANFFDEYQSFIGKTKYSDWLFVAAIQPQQQVVPGPPVLP